MVLVLVDVVVANYQNAALVVVVVDHLSRDQRRARSCAKKTYVQRSARPAVVRYMRKVKVVLLVLPFAPRPMLLLPLLRTGQLRASLAMIAMYFSTTDTRPAPAMN
jgi:hypothetical protein